MQIAPNETPESWNCLRSKLTASPFNAAAWDYAFEHFYRARLKSRYFDSIEKLTTDDKEAGEGFTITAILCTLVEYLESFEQGRKFRYCRKGEKCDETEYSQAEARDVFTQFLTEQRPFVDSFTSDVADSFYRNVRCGLLHEACTKGGWLIWCAPDPNSRMIESRGPWQILYRDRFLAGFSEYLRDYRDRLFDNPALRDRFDLKFDHLSACGQPQ